MPIVTVPGQGDVEFPDSMSDEQIVGAIKKLGAPPATSAVASGDTAVGGGWDKLAQAAPTFTERAANSAMGGFGDEAVGGYKAIVKKLMGDQQPIGDIYRTDRDAMRTRMAEEKKAHPGAALAGDIAGGAVTAAALPAGAAATLLRAAGTGAALGGINALGSSTADVTKGDIGGAAKDTGVGTLVGGGVGAAGKFLLSLLPSIAAKARDVAVSQGRRVLTGGANPLAVKQPVSEDAVMEAFNQGAIKPFSTVRTANAVLDRSREDVGQQYAAILQELEAKGVTGPKAQALASDLLSESHTLSSNSLNSPKPVVFQGTAEELATKPVNSQGQLGLMQAENMKRTLQREATYGNVTDPLGNEAKKDVASRMREAIENEVQAQANKAPAEAASFEPVKAQLSRIIEASNAASKGAAQYERRAAFGLPEYIMGANGHAPMMLATKLLRSRGASTAAVGAKGAADAIEAILSPQTPQQKFLADLIMQRSLPLSSELGGEYAGQ